MSSIWQCSWGLRGGPVHHDEDDDNNHHNDSTVTYFATPMSAARPTIPLTTVVTQRAVSRRFPQFSSLLETCTPDFNTIESDNAQHCWLLTHVPVHNVLIFFWKIPIHSSERTWKKEPCSKWRAAVPNPTGKINNQESSTINTHNVKVFG